MPGTIHFILDPDEDTYSLRWMHMYIQTIEYKIHVSIDVIVIVYIIIYYSPKFHYSIICMCLDRSM